MPQLRHDDGVRVMLADPVRNCWADYRPGFLTPVAADAVLEQARRSPFAADRPGREGYRESVAFGTPGLTYRYADLERTALDWPFWLVPLLAQVERAALKPWQAFNFVLVNRYPSGKAGLGWHADDEPELDPEAPIASLSLGADRDFDFRLGNRGPRVARVTLEHGSLLLMRGETQRHYQHQLPKRAKCEGERINLTFRRLRA